MEHKKKRSDLTYVIASHPKYTKALTPLIDSMYVSGVDAGEILVVLSDCASGDSCTNYNIMSGIRYVTIKNNIYEYGAHLGIVKAVEDGLVSRINDFAIIHDTCLVGNNFKKKCLELQSRSKSQMTWACGIGQFNIGIFRYEASEHMNNMFKETWTLDKDFGIGIELNSNYMSLKRAPVSHYYCHEVERPIMLGKCDIYGDGRQRDVAYLPTMDLYKFFFWVAHGSHHPNSIGG